MDGIITIIIWIIIGILNLFCCLVGIAPTWISFWSAYGCLIICLLDRRINKKKDN